MRTRVKVCGLTREQDVAAAVDAGADALGFVCYPRSPRFVSAQRLRALAAELGPFVTPVLLFVNADVDAVEQALSAVPNALLQFHGDESEQACARFGRPFIRAVRVATGRDLLDAQTRYSSALALLADAPSEGFGGSGRSFDWSLLPASRRKPLILAGGLDETNVATAIASIRPFAVDVSTGVEEAPGIKNGELLRRFAAAVRVADDAVSERPVTA